MYLLDWMNKYLAKKVGLSRIAPVLKDQRDVIRTKGIVEGPNYYGLTPVEVASYLDRRECMLLLDPKRKDHVVPDRWLPFFKTCRYIEHLIFSDARLFKSALARVAEAFREGEIDERKIWRGSYFSQEMISKKIPEMEIAKIDETFGCGLFAQETIPSCTFIGEYVGIVKRYAPLFSKANPYSLRYPTRFLGKKEYLIDASVAGNHTRFINHSYFPNLELESVFLPPLSRMIFVSKRRIEKGEQLTFDYGDQFWKDRKEEPL